MTVAADIIRADQQAQLIVGTFVAAQNDPAMWERFTDRMFNEFERQSRTRPDSGPDNWSAAVAEASATSGRSSAHRDTLAGLDAAAPDRHAQHAQASERGEEAFM